MLNFSNWDLARLLVAVGLSGWLVIEAVLFLARHISIVWLP